MNCYDCNTRVHNISWAQCLSGSSNGADWHLMLQPWTQHMCVSASTLANKDDSQRDNWIYREFSDSQCLTSDPSKFFMSTLSAETASCSEIPGSVPGSQRNYYLRNVSDGTLSFGCNVDCSQCEFETSLSVAEYCANITDSTTASRSVNISQVRSLSTCSYEPWSTQGDSSSSQKVG